MALWYIGGGILALLALLLALPVSLRLLLAEEIRLSAAVGPLRFQVYPRIKEKKDQKDSKEDKPRKPEEAARPGKRPGLGRPNRAQLRYSAERLGRLAARLLRRQRRGLRVRPLRLCVTVGGEDPADAAVLYGRLHAAAGTLLPLLRRAVRVREEDVSIALDFEKAATEVRGEIGLRTRVIHLLGLALGATLGAAGWYFGYRKLASEPADRGGEAKAESRAPAA